MDYDCLIIDDERLLADSTAEYFNLFGVRTAVSYSAEECRRFFGENTAGLLLLDINLGDGSGFELCRELRARTDIPILFLSARTSDDDKIIALNIGGDDYIQKPCSLSVLLAKVKVVLKRYGASGREQTQDGYSDSRLTVDFGSRQVLVEGAPVKLTALEFRLLTYLIRNQGNVVAKRRRNLECPYPQDPGGHRAGSRKTGIYHHNLGRRIQILRAFLLTALIHFQPGPTASQLCAPFRKRFVRHSWPKSPQEVSI